MRWQRTELPVSLHRVMALPSRWRRLLTAVSAVGLCLVALGRSRLPGGSLWWDLLGILAVLACLFVGFLPSGSFRVQVQVLAGGLRVWDRGKVCSLRWDEILSVDESVEGLVVRTHAAELRLPRELSDWEALVSQVRAGASHRQKSVEYADVNAVLGDSVVSYLFPWQAIFDRRFVLYMAAVMVLTLVVGDAVSGLFRYVLVWAGAMSYCLLRDPSDSCPALEVSAEGLCSTWTARLTGKRRVVPWSAVLQLCDDPAGWRIRTAGRDYLLHRRGRNAAEAADAIRKVLALRDQGLPLPRMDMTPAGAISRVDVSAERGLMRAEEEDGETEG